MSTTSVSEMIRKGALAEAQTALRKQEIHSVECGYLSLCQNSVRNCCCMQNFTEIGQSKSALVYQISTKLGDFF